MIDLKLSFKRLHSQLRDNGIAVALLIVSAVLCILAFTNMFIRYMPIFNDARKNNMKYRFYSIIFSESIDYPTTEEIMSFLPDLDSLMLSNVESSLDISEVGQPNINLACFYHETDHINRVELVGSTLKNYRDLGEYEVVLPITDFFEDIPQTITIAGQNFEVVGTWNGFDYLVSRESFFEITEATHIVFKTQDVLSPEALHDLHEHLLAYPIDSARTPLQEYENDADNSPIVMIVINFIYLLSIASYLMIFSALIHFLEKDFRIYRYIGMHKNRIIIGFMLDLFILISTCVWIAFAIHELFWEGFFAKASQYEGQRISLSHYLLIYLLIIVISFIVLFPYVRTTIQHTIKRRKGID